MIILVLFGIEFYFELLLSSSIGVLSGFKVIIGSYKGGFQFWAFSIDFGALCEVVLR